MKDSAVREILFSYQQKRDKAEYEFEERKKKIYNRFPEIQKIDDDITNVGLRMMRIVISNSPDKEIQLNQYKDKLNALKLSKNNLLKMHNIPKNALEIQYECPLCEDTGFLKSGEKCNCFKQALINEYYKMSNISRNFKTQNFNTLDLSLFSDDIIPELNISSKQNILTRKTPNQYNCSGVFLFLLLLCKFFFCKSCKCCETFFIIYCKLSKHLSVNINVCQF